MGLIVAAAAAAWWNAFGGAFLYDDINILNAPVPENPAGFLYGLDGAIRPLAALSYLADRVLWGDDPAGYHLLNVLLHLGSALLVWSLVDRLAPARRGVALWTALLFAVHPMATEAVTYVSGRPTAMMGFLYLAALRLHLAGRRGWALSAFAGALACKEIAVTLPLALLLADAVALGHRGPALRADLRRHLPFWLLLAAALALGALHPRYGALLAESLALRSPIENLAVQAQAVAYSLVLFADPRQLSMVHHLDLATSFADPAAMAAGLALLVLVVAAARRGHPLEAFGVLWFVLQLLPTNSLLPRLEILSERNLYLASAGLYVAFVSLAARLAQRIQPRLRAAAPALGIAAVCALAGATLARNALYADPVAFWSDAVAKAPASDAARVNLGYSHYLAGRRDEAIAHFRAALAIDRDNPVAQANLRALFRDGNR